VGLELQPALTHWVTISYFIPPFGNPNDLSLAWHEHPLIHTFPTRNLNTKCATCSEVA
jgi:hypothetical protein